MRVKTKTGKPDKVYYITFKDEANKFKRVKIGRQSEGITEAYCYQKRAETLQKIKLGEEVTIKYKKRKKFTFGQMYEEYLKWAKNNKDTWVNDKQAFDNHLYKFKDIEVSQLRSKDFEELKQQKLEEGLSPKTVQHILSYVRQAFNHAIRNDLVKNLTNPISDSKVKMPKVDNAKTGFFKYDEAKLLLDTLKRKDKKDLYRLTVLLLFTDARFSEIASLTWNDVNFEQRLIYFSMCKGGKPRYIQITNILMEVLQELYEERIDSLVIPIMKGKSKGKQREQMPKQWQDIVDEIIPGNKTAGKARLTVHSLRHTHASWLAINGLDILHIKEQLGHKKIETTMRYAHLIPNKRHEATLLLEEKINKVGSQTKSQKSLDSMQDIENAIKNEEITIEQLEEELKKSIN